MSLSDCESIGLDAYARCRVFDLAGDPHRSESDGARTRVYAERPGSGAVREVFVLESYGIPLREALRRAGAADES